MHSWSTYECSPLSSQSCTITPDNRFLMGRLLYELYHAIVLGCIPKMHIIVCRINIPLNTSVSSPRIVQLFIIFQEDKLKELFKMQSRWGWIKLCTQTFGFTILAPSIESLKSANIDAKTKNQVRCTDCWFFSFFLHCDFKIFSCVFLHRRVSRPARKHNKY